jgi:hypothetical protein
MFGRRTREPSQMHTPSMRTAVAAALVFAALQGLFWWHSHAIRPDMGIVPEVPGEQTVRALSFGDEEVFFRFYALGLQNSGDTFGRFTALYKYDFNKLTQWFYLLGKLNNQSNYLPAMATYYFSQTQNPTDVGYIVDYLDAYTKDRVKEKWWWVVQGTYLAEHKFNNLERAGQLAERLRGVRGIPIWAQQMPAFIHERRGEFGEALAIIEEVAKHPEDYTEGELNFMRYFVDERLGRLDAVKKEFDEIKKTKEELKAKGVKEPEMMGPPPDVGAARVPGPGSGD